MMGLRQRKKWPTETFQYTVILSKRYKFVAYYLIKIGIFKDEMTLFSNASVLSCHNHVNDMSTCLI